MAAGQGAGARRVVLSRSRPRAAAAPLSVHRQRPRRGHPGQAPGAGGHRRPPHASAHAGRDLRPARGAGAARRRVLRGGRRGPAPAEDAARGDPGAGRACRAGPGLRHRRHGRPRHRALQARQPPVRAEGDADPGRPARARACAGRGRAERPPGVDGPVAARRHRAGRRLAHARARRRSGPGGIRPLVREPGGTLARAASRGARRSVAGVVAHLRRHGRAAGAPGPRAHRGGGAAGVRVEPYPRGTGIRRARPAPAGGRLGSGRARRVPARPGRAVPAAGPSGAPTRGRLDVLPTGRNFYSVDTRTVPTRRPGSWAGSRPPSCWSATGRSTGHGRSASRSPRGAPRTCAPAATTSRRRSRSWG